MIINARRTMQPKGITRAVAASPKDAAKYCAEKGKRLPSVAEVQRMVELKQPAFVTQSHFRGPRAFTWITSDVNFRAGFMAGRFSPVMGNMGLFSKNESNGGDVMAQDAAFFCVSDSKSK